MNWCRSYVCNGIFELQLPRDCDVGCVQRSDDGLAECLAAQEFMKAREGCVEIIGIQAGAGFAEFPAQTGREWIEHQLQIIDVLIAVSANQFCDEAGRCSARWGDMAKRAKEVVVPARRIGIPTARADRFEKAF